jgi:hypothetical protein
MSEFLAQFISCCIATVIDERLKGKYCLSSYEYELLEQSLQRGKFDDIEKWIMKITGAL